MSCRGPLSALLLIVFCSSAMAGTFEDGHTAYMRGDYAQSLKLLRGLARSGHPAAAYVVGRQYQLGQGVKRDLAEAWYWFRRAEAKGHVEAGLFRHLLITKWKISGADRRRGEAKYAALAKGTPKSSGRIALRPTARPVVHATAPAAAVATVSTRPRPAVRVSELPVPQASPTKAAAPPLKLPSATAPPSQPEVAVRSKSDRCEWCRSIAPGPREDRVTRAPAPPPSAVTDDNAVEPGDDDVAVEPGAYEEDVPYRYAPSLRQPGWDAEPPSLMLSPGYWRYRIWQERERWRRRSWRRYHSRWRRYD